MRAGNGGRRLADPLARAGKAHDGSHEGIPPPGSPFNAPAPARPAQTFAVHDQVTHDKYGLGVILGVEDDAVLVDFRPPQRRISLPCAKLTKLQLPSPGCAHKRDAALAASLSAARSRYAPRRHSRRARFCARPPRALPVLAEDRAAGAGRFRGTTPSGGRRPRRAGPRG